MGWLYTRLAASNSLNAEDAQAIVLTSEDDEEPTEESALVPRRRKTVLSNSVEEFMAMYASLTYLCIIDAEPGIRMKARMG